MKKKTVFITGASRGIGRACALLFASKGYFVYLNCRRSIEALYRVQEEIEASYPQSTHLVIGDVGNPQDIASIFATINASSQGIDVLINNAGIAHIGLLTDMSLIEWDQIIATNLSSVFYCTKAALPYMIQEKHGRIINISSMWGTAGASCEAAYSASKSGVHGLTKSLAKELAPSNITVNAIACGVIDTAMNDTLSDEDRNALMDEIPMGRFGTADEVAQLSLSIAEGPAYMTGQIIGIDGGFI